MTEKVFISLAAGLMAKSITLINPSGQQKELGAYEFYKLKVKFSKSKPFIAWAATNKVNCMETTVHKSMIRVNHKGIVQSKTSVKFNPLVVDQFLKEMNYTVIEKP